MTREIWSKAKKYWCCEFKRIGCSGGGEGTKHQSGLSTQLDDSGRAVVEKNTFSDKSFQQQPNQVTNPSRTRKNRVRIPEGEAEGKLGTAGR